MVEWRDIEGYEGLYMVSDQGDIFNCSRNSLMKLRKDRKGYLLVGLTKKGNQKTYRVHRIVANAFINNIFKKPQINHLNEVKHDNRVDNLEWVTNKENSNYGSRNTKISLSKGKPVKGVNIKTGEEITFQTVSEVISYGFDKSHVASCARGESKTHKGFIWKYV